MKTKGAIGPITLRCSACGRRAVGKERPFVRTGRERMRKRTKYNRRASMTREVRCVCGWAFFTNHRDAETFPLTD